MQIEFDRNKRDKTPAERGLDFAQAREVFAGRHVTAADLCKDHGETRLITVGQLEDAIVVVVWTPRGKVRCIISMGKANERERKRALYAIRVG